MLGLIGIGLSDANDITRKGLAWIQEADKVYLEGYTSKLNTSIGELEAAYDTTITAANRHDLEQDHQGILDEAQKNDVAVLIIGDVFSATTHAMLYVEAQNQGIETTVVHNASIFSAIAQTGLQLYKFGKTTSIVAKDGWVPSTPYEAVKENSARGLHTLCLLDIEASAAGSDTDDEFMTASQAVSILQHLEKEHGDNVITETTEIVIVQDLSGPNQQIWRGTVDEIGEFTGTTPLHSLVIPADLHDMEVEMLDTVSEH